MIKKFLSLTLLFTLMTSIIAGCSSNTPQNTEVTSSPQQTATQEVPIENTTVELTEPTKIHIACMKGPTAIGMIHMLSESDAQNTQNNYVYTIAGTADEVSAGLVNGSLDVAAVPCNLASILYNKTNGEIVTVAINTLGVLYIVEAGDSIQTVSDLAGKTIYSTGQGTTPEYTLRYLLSSAGLNPDSDVTIEYKSEATEVVAAMAQNPEAIAMLPQPFVISAMNNNDKLRIALDVTAEWEKLNDSTVVTGVIVARKTFIEENPDAFGIFLEEYETSTAYANANIDDTSALLEKYDVFKAAIAKKAIPYCNVTYIDGEEMKKYVLAYLQVLYDENPASIGGKSPEEGLFYLNDAK